MKIIGYYNSFERQEVLSRLNLSTLTHLNYAFLLPRPDGTAYLRDEEDARRAINIATTNGLKAFISVGGWCDGNVILNDVFNRICDSKITLDILIQNIISVVEKFGFDGIDLDWEFPTAKRQMVFCYMVDRLSNYTKSKGKGFSIAIHHSVKGEENYKFISAINDEVVSKVDWLNIMTYDCEKEPNHSSLQLAEKCIDYWVKDRGVDKKKIMIGIPLYSRPSFKKYYEFVDENHANAFKDFIGDESLNGIYMAREKAYYAKFNCGGLIIWAINYDSLVSKYSLLQAISTIQG